jgi:hypothetical protein
MILTNAKVVLDGNDVSDLCTKISLRQSRKQETDSAMGDDTEIFENGIRQIAMTMTFKKSAELATILRDIDDAGDPVELVVRRDKDDDVSEDNPQATGDFNLASFNPLDAAWGAKEFFDVTFSPASSLAWATA